MEEWQPLRVSLYRSMLQPVEELPNYPSLPLGCLSYPSDNPQEKPTIQCPVASDVCCAFWLLRSARTWGSSQPMSSEKSKIHQRNTILDPRPSTGFLVSIHFTLGSNFILQPFYPWSTGSNHFGFQLGVFNQYCSGKERTKWRYLTASDSRGFESQHVGLYGFMWVHNHACNCNPFGTSIARAVFWFLCIS